MYDRMIGVREPLRLGADRRRVRGRRRVCVSLIPPSAPAGGILRYANLSPPLHQRTSRRPPGPAATVHLTRVPRSAAAVNQNLLCEIAIETSARSQPCP